MRIAMFRNKLNEAKLTKQNVNLTSWETIYKKVATLPAGSSFGELALMDSRGAGKRAATIEAEQQCFFGVITKEDFDKSLSKIMTLQKEQIINFIANVPYFKGLSKGAIDKIVMSLNSQKCMMNQVITHEVLNKEDRNKERGDADKNSDEDQDDSQCPHHKYTQKNTIK